MPATEQIEKAVFSDRLSSQRALNSVSFFPRADLEVVESLDQNPWLTMDKYIGKYDRVSADKYEDFLKELDVNFMLRKAATASSPVFEVHEFIFRQMTVFYL